MLRVILSSMIAIVLGFTSLNTIPIANAKAQQQTTAIATPTKSAVIINKKKVPLQGYTINGSNYFNLRDLAYYLNGTSKQFSVGWNGKLNTIELQSGAPYQLNKDTATTKQGNQTAILSQSKIVINNKAVTLTAYTINGNTYFKLRDLGDHLNFPVVYHPVEESIRIMTAAEVTIQQASQLDIGQRTVDYKYSNYRRPQNRSIFESDNKLYILEYDYVPRINVAYFNVGTEETNLWYLTLYFDASGINGGTIITHFYTTEQLSKELDAMKIVLETDLQKKLPVYTDAVLTEIVKQVPNLKEIDDTIRFEIQSKGLTIEVAAILENLEVLGEPTTPIHLNIDFHVE